MISEFTQRVLYDEKTRDRFILAPFKITYSTIVSINIHWGLVAATLFVKDELRVHTARANYINTFAVNFDRKAAGYGARD